MTRKEILEEIAAKGETLKPHHAQAAWHILMEWLWYMSEPESPRTPKFRDLTHALDVILSPYENPHTKTSPPTEVKGDAHYELNTD